MAYIAEEFAGGKSQSAFAPTFPAAYLAGGFSGRFIAGYVGEWVGWRGDFYTLAALAFVGAVLVLWRLPPSCKFTARRNVGLA
jgi:YNFM family putative membrane transporter